MFRLSKQKGIGAMIEKLRNFGKRTLRRWPRAYLAAKRWFGTTTYWLRVPHDRDFSFFRNFSGREGLVVDIGANTGQSARSIRIFNRSLEILSFEPNRLLEPELAATRNLLGPGFEYRLFGLGRRQQMLTLYCPVASGTPLSPWATADRASLEHNRSAIEREVGTQVSVTTVAIEIRRFDDLGLRPLAAKIDVEGLELDVLEGMRETLAACEPILMIECSEHTPEAVALLSEYGYHTYSYDPSRNTLRETDTPAASTNYFACTPAALERLTAGSKLRVLRAPLESATPVAV
jgi:FkbM family methyltransferase